ncbi:hypothetical protein [Inquilinus limosus]|uniref:Uncharacterized protein n=1 Tax=Inquilinus limosus MP06 TaxID=1398085 RepID=A0A0A0DAF9_9PROT|nr:hypothetical protein [Inquilinus limosus]KGM35706.1 hypothetical protein P409_03005 [Inquilinus limosus MP06]
MLQSAAGGGDNNISMPRLNPIVGQPQTMDALAQAVMARGGGGLQPGSMPGRVAMPTFNSGYAQQYGNLMDAMMSRYPGQLRQGGSVFDAQARVAAPQQPPAAPAAPAVAAPQRSVQTPLPQFFDRIRSGR